MFGMQFLHVSFVGGALGVISQFRPIIWAENNAYFDSGGKGQVMGQVGAVSRRE